ncbi:MAG TPA: helix-turn-helix transcriptional regulator, partial [Kineosporiaceae bacterium]|nr:helix-turn-helix transcriptional regulator [Kineosporiaceae bacterium]
MTPMPAPGEPVRIGERVRRARRARGMTLQVLADLSGLSKSFLSMVENGERHLERRRYIVAIADALNVSPADLIGTAAEFMDSQLSGGHESVHEVRVALLTSTLDHPAATSSAVSERLLKEAEEINVLRLHCQFDAVGRRLRDLIPEAHQAARSHEPTMGLRALVIATQAATFWLKYTGYADLAWIAAERGRQAAERLEDPVWIGAADFARAQALSGLGAYTAMGDVAAAAAQATDRDSQAGLEVYGIHLLNQAFAASANGATDVSAALNEARDVAARTGEGDAFGLMFGPANVDLWAIGIALEQDKPDEALQIGRALDPRVIPTPYRRSAYYLDLAAALVHTGHTSEAILELRRAEKIAPQRFQNSPLARELIAVMLQRSTRNPDGRELRN